MPDYVTTLEVIRTAGVGSDIFNEIVGTGDSANKSFSLDNGNVVAASYVLQYGAATGNDVNDLTDLTETTHYTIDLNGGDILLTSAGVTELGTNVLYADYVHSEKISDAGIQHMIERAQDEIDLFTGNYWGSVKSSTQVMDGRETDRYPSTNFPYVRQDPDEQDTLQLKYKGVASITSITYLTTSAGSNTVLDSTDYTFNEDGLIVLYRSTLPIGRLNVEVIFTHGYTTVPTYIKQLVELMSSIMIFSAITGGSYDDATVFTLGRKSISIGEVYVNSREAVAQFKKRMEPLLLKAGNDMVVC